MRRTFKQLACCAVALALTVTSVLGPADTHTVSKAALPTRVSVHDPSIAVSKEGRYYLFGSHIDAAWSDNLIDWTSFTNGYATTNNQIFGNLADNLKKSFAWAGQNDVDSRGGFSVWAPDVFWNPDYVNADGTTGAYMMYFCTTSTAVRSVISFATSPTIEGLSSSNANGYTFGDTILYSGFTKEDAYDAGSKINKKYTNTNIDELIANGTLDGLNNDWFKGNTGYNNSYAPNAIDPTVFYDKDNNLWMTYGSWSGGIYVLQINKQTGKPIYPGKSSKTDDTRIVDSYFGTRIAGGYTKSGEGPYILYDKESDYYYLYVTYEGLVKNGGYNMRLFRSKSPDGPYVDAAGNNAALKGAVAHNNIGIKVMGNYTLSSVANPYMAPGHNSALIDDKSGQRYLFYHTRFQDGELHRVRVHQQFLNEEGWPVTAVYENKNDTISSTGYSNDEIVGEYEFINHGTNPDGSNVKSPSTVVLNSNGKITGDVTGTWTKTDGTYYMSATIGGVKYSGVFFKQSNESTYNTKTMTFTAIGTNNSTIWGAKKSPSMKVAKTTLYYGGNTGKTTTAKVSGVSGTSATIKYKSSKPSVATINSKGKITAKKKGKTTISAVVTVGGTSRTFTKKVKVKKAYIKITKKKSSIKAKKSYKFKAKGYGIKASSIRWKSNKKSVITIKSKTGKATAKKKGSAKITASYKKIKVSTKVKVK